ncbi:MAG: hypothetical protein E7646_07735 [Ruminococcaceae bacterium]|nr:hypothetical protein [Oscillospiraceae bacterium]
MLYIPPLPLSYQGRDIRELTLGGAEPFKWFFDRYTLFVNGEECPVRECRVSAIPFNRPWPGKQRDIAQTEMAGYSVFYSDEAVTVTVKVDGGFEKAVVRPLGAGIKVERLSSDTARFTLDKNGAYVFEADGEHSPLEIFYEKKPVEPSMEGITKYYGPGIHFEGIVRLYDNDVVYVHPEAQVFASFNAIGARNIRIFGGGVIDGGTERRLFEHCYENFTKGTVRFYDCEDVVIEDVILKDSATWVLSMFRCDRVRIDNVKEVGNWRYNTDGIDLCNCRDVLIQNCYIHVFDDGITIKGVSNWDRSFVPEERRDRSVYNIVIDKCILWCGWGRTCEIGVESSAPEMTGIVFKNCDCIRNTHAVLDARAGWSGYIHHVSFENINVELHSDYQRPVRQRDFDDDQVYTPEESKYTVPAVMYVDDKSFANSVPGKVSNVSFKNIFVIADDGVPKPEVSFVSYNGGVRDIYVDGVYFNGVRQKDLSLFDTSKCNVRPIFS